MVALLFGGVDARKNGQEIDSAIGLQEISQIGLFCSRLHELSNQAVLPTVDGILHRKFETKADLGFAATLVPESSSGPHMAKLGENRYYKRNGASFLQLEHFDLEDMFGRRPRPNLEVSVENLKSTSGIEGETITIHLLNTGRGLAKHIEIFGEITGGNLVSARRPFQDVSRINVGRQMFSYTDNAGVIHANSIKMLLGSIVVTPKDGENIHLNFNVCCESMSAKHFEFTVAPEILPTEPILTT